MEVSLLQVQEENNFNATTFSIKLNELHRISENDSELWEKLARVLYSRQKMTAFVS